MDVDHRELFRLASQVKGDVLLTYEDRPEVRAVAADFGFACRAIAMKNRHNKDKVELVLGRDLTWAGRNT